MESAHCRSRNRGQLAIAVGAAYKEGLFPAEVGIATAATVEIPYLLYLGPDGKPVRKDLPAFARELDQLRELFRTILFVPGFGTSEVNMQRSGKHRTYASCLIHRPLHIY